MDSNSDDVNLNNIIHKDATDVVISADGDSDCSEITTEADINQKKRLTIMNNDSEDENLNKIIEKDTTNVVNTVDNEEIAVLPVEKGKRQRKRLTVIDSDSEDNIENIPDKEEDGLTKIGSGEIDNEKKIQRKRFTVFNSDDSDSESDKEKTIANQEGTVEHRSEETTKFDTTETEGKNKQRKRLTIINSDDSESENENEETIANQEGLTVEHRAEETTKLDTTEGENKKRKRLTIINSDDSVSENENEETISHQEGSKVPPTVEHLAEEIIEERTVEVSAEGKKKSRLMQICDSDSEDESINVNKSTTIYSENIFDDNTERATRLQNLCDAESSAEEDEPQKMNHTQVSKAKKSAKPPKDKDLLEKPMTGRDAMEQRRQIKSESQKMCRETHVSLPYHRPKQHTLQDFLKRRSLMNNIIKVPPNTPTSYAIKMSAQELKKTAEQLKEREKNIELFYKSESEEEEECEEQVRKDDDKMEEVSQKEIEQVVHPAEEEKSLECVVDGTENDKIVKEVLEIEKEVVQETEKLTEDFVADKDISFAEDEEMESIQTKITEVIDSIDDTVTEEVEKNTEIDKSDDDIENSEKDTEEKLEELRVVLQENLGSINQSVGKKLKEPTFEELQKKITPEEEKENKCKKLKEPTFEELLSSSILPPPVEPQKKITPEEEKEHKIEERLKKLNPLIALKRFSEPIRLSGNANEIIVLDEGVDRSKNVSNLMKRFFIHTAKKQVQKKTEISVLNADGSGRHHETILVTEDVEEPAKKHQIPGLRMKKLREELQEQIKQKRLEEYMKKKAEYKLDNEEGDGSPYVGEKTDCGLDDEILDNDDEEEFTDEDVSSEEEEDEEEDDVELKETPRVKSAFVDEEAEESDMEDQDDDVVENDEAEDDDAQEDEPEEHLESQAPKTLKRIIQTLDDSDDENVDENAERNIEENQEKICDNVETSQPQSTWDEFDGEIPAYQPRNGLEKTPCKLMTQKEQDISCFLSPTLNLTALQGRKVGDSTIIEESPKIVVSVPPKPSPLRDHPFLKTRLFSQNSEIVDEFDELAALCSGKFPSPKKNIDSAGLSTQEQSLLDICSGTFSGLEQSNNEEKTIQDSNECSTSKDAATQSSAKPFDARNFNYPKYKICSSSDEETVSQDENKTKKLKKKRRYVIDDISLSDDDEEDKENDFDDLLLKGEEEIDEDDEERQNINYDSEENEVDEETEQIAKKKAREFFEAEAELSGSEWGSEDEDEKGLDDFEAEDADGEKINEKKVQQELERMHIRNVLDDDQRDIRLLQEMLLEDGELHGEGREKKFKWKNTASLTWNEDNTPKDEDEEVEDIESEQQWRKMRHEREAFLHEQKMKAQLDDEDFTGSDSQFLKLGQMALQKSMESSQMKTTVTETIVRMDDIKLPFNLNNKRGSFLARSETTLARLREITRNTGGINNGPKNSRNFVFTAIEKTEKSTTFVENDKKRKAEETVPKVPKKIRITKPNVPKPKS